MMDCQHLVDAYRIALEAESRLWDDVKGRAPGQPGHDRTRWVRWLEAVVNTNALAKAICDTYAGDVPPG